MCAGGVTIDRYSSSSSCLTSCIRTDGSPSKDVVCPRGECHAVAAHHRRSAVVTARTAGGRGRVRRAPAWAELLLADRGGALVVRRGATPPRAARAAVTTRHTVQ